MSERRAHPQRKLALLIIAMIGVPIALTVAAVGVPPSVASAETAGATTDSQVTVRIPGGATTAPTGTGTTSGGSSGGSSQGGGGGSSSGSGDGTTTTTPTAPVPPAAPHTNAGILKVTPNTVTAGASVTVTGTGYTPGEQAQLVLYSSPVVINSYMADASGQVRVTIVVPKATLTGQHTLELVGWQSKQVLAGGLTIVTAAPVTSGSTVPSSFWGVIAVIVGILLAAIIAILLLSRFLRRPTVAPESVI